MVAAVMGPEVSRGGIGARGRELSWGWRGRWPSLCGNGPLGASPGWTGAPEGTL